MVQTVIAQELAKQANVSMRTIKRHEQRGMIPKAMKDYRGRLVYSKLSADRVLDYFTRPRII